MRRAKTGHKRAGVCASDSKAGFAHGSTARLNGSFRLPIILHSVVIASSFNGFNIKGISMAEKSVFPKFVIPNAKETEP